MHSGFLDGFSSHWKLLNLNLMLQRLQKPHILATKDRIEVFTYDNDVITVIIVSLDIQLVLLPLFAFFLFAIERMDGLEGMEGCDGAEFTGIAQLVDGEIAGIAERERGGRR